MIFTLYCLQTCCCLDLNILNYAFYMDYCIVRCFKYFNKCFIELIQKALNCIICGP